MSVRQESVTTYYENGSIQNVETRTKGKLTQKTEYYETGQKQYDIDIWEDSATLKFYFKNGRKRMLLEYPLPFERESIQTRMSFFKDNSPKSMCDYRKDETLHGYCVNWYRNGKLRVICEMDDGKRNGEHIEWDENGRMTLKGRWDNNSSIGIWTHWDEENNKYEELIMGATL